MGGGSDGSGARHKRSAAASRAMTIRAERTQCEACKRKNATKQHLLDDGMIRIDKCRYCGHERTVWDKWKDVFDAEKKKKEGSTT